MGPLRPPMRTYSYLRYESLMPEPDAEVLDPDSEPEYLEFRQAKRRRVEEYARQYLKGDSLFIASASLKGPFPKGWVNPWRRDRATPLNGDTAVIDVVDTEEEIPATNREVDMMDSASDKEDEPLHELKIDPLCILQDSHVEGNRTDEDREVGAAKVIRSKSTWSMRGVEILLLHCFY
jgi:hypothetical protein